MPGWQHDGSNVWRHTTGLSVYEERVGDAFNYTVSLPAEPDIVTPQSVRILAGLMEAISRLGGSKHRHPFADQNGNLLAFEVPLGARLDIERVLPVEPADSGPSGWLEVEDRLWYHGPLGASVFGRIVRMHGRVYADTHFCCLTGSEPVLSELISALDQLHEGVSYPPSEYPTGHVARIYHWVGPTGQEPDVGLLLTEGE